MQLDKIMDGLTKELAFSLKSMAKTKDLTEKATYSEVVKNLCESLGVFLDLASDMTPYEFDLDGDENPDDIPF